uniref:DNA primase n=1 Tax=Crocodylus porosus TaxID=8502 RepID=A0A7M4ECW4_CROPO
WAVTRGMEKGYFARREFSFTLRDDIYVRYQSFERPQDLEKELQKACPYKVDIGAVYSHRPSQHNTLRSGAFQAQEKELVFDVDMTDYDDVRGCCSSAEICSKCWTLMTIAIRILDRALVEDLGVQHRLWVYSGRRGVHCWVCDDTVRKWSSSLRSSIVDYLSLVKGGADTVKKVHLSDPVHPFISKSLRLVEEYFEQYALLGQDILGCRESWDKVLALVPEHILLPGSSCLSLRLGEGLAAVGACSSSSSKKLPSYTEQEIMLQFCFPRLDGNVSKGLNHLLKSPFSVHPKTGRISVPIDIQRLEQFDPFAVPTISSLCRELDEANDEDKDKENEEDPESRRRVRDYKRTSLAPYVRVFECFVEDMERARRGELLRRSDLQGDF